MQMTILPKARALLISLAKKYVLDHSIASISSHRFWKSLKRSSLNSYSHTANQVCAGPMISVTRDLDHTVHRTLGQSSYWTLKNSDSR